MEQFDIERIGREINDRLEEDWGPSQVTMHNEDDPLIGSLNELIEVLQDLVKQHPEAGNVGVQVEEDWISCHECSDEKLANHCVDFKRYIVYNPTGSNGYERSGCVIIRGGE